MELKFTKTLLTIPKEEAASETYQEIKEGAQFKGHNLWLLAAAMVIACVGLNAGNNAAIIGAMLISPLMGPIIGFAFGLSIYSPSMMRFCVYNWIIMVVTSLISASLFFIITPFHNATPELLGFTQATFFDVVLAFVGGAAGFLGIVKKEGVKVIAGVAVATACIPPLCTAGYGIATLQWTVFVGGAYFFLINCFFIGLATWITSRLIGFRALYQGNTWSGKRLTSWMTVIGFALLIPSIWLAIKKYDTQQQQTRADRYVDSIQKQYPDLVILKHQTSSDDRGQVLDISLLNDSAEVAQSVLQAANDLDTTIEVIWHFVPNQAQQEIELLKKQVAHLDSSLQLLQHPKK